LVISYLLAMLPPFLANQAADQALSNIEIAKLGKAATGYVYAGQRWPIGAAFCVDRSGLFLTADCVIPQDSRSQPITVVLDPGGKNPHRLSARLVRYDQNLNLALLRVEKQGKLPSLRLGTSEGLKELAEFVALGFSSWDPTSAGPLEYPPST